MKPYLGGIVCLALLFSAAAGNAITLGVGVNAGYGTLRTGDNNDRTNSLGVPASNPVSGIRVSAATSDRRFELFSDLGLGINTLDQKHEYKVTTGDFVAKASFQYNILPARVLSPYVFGGGGWDFTWSRTQGLGTDYDGNPALYTYREDANSAIVGGGAGLARGLADGHGRVRFDLRYDRLTKFHLNLFSAKVGLDLWFGGR
jgi:hypothetical protein